MLKFKLNFLYSQIVTYWLHNLIDAKLLLHNLIEGGKESS